MKDWLREGGARALTGQRGPPGDCDPTVPPALFLPEGEQFTVFRTQVRGLLLSSEPKGSSSLVPAGLRAPGSEQGQRTAARV